MNKKNTIIIICLAVINFVACTLLTIFAMPNQIPISYDIYEKITILSTKWIMLLSAIIPTIIIILSFLVTNKKACYFLKMLFILGLYENTLFFTYFCLSNNLSIGSLCEIPMAAVIFMPIAVMITILSIKLKNVPYLSKPAINFKIVRETEFIWTQTHFFARDLYFGMGILLFLISIVFVFVRFALALLAIYFIVIIIFTIILYNYTATIYDKYNEMKERKEKLDKKQNPDSPSTIKRIRKKKNTKKIDGSRLM